MSLSGWFIFGAIFVAIFCIALLRQMQTQLGRLEQRFDEIENRLKSIAEVPKEIERLIDEVNAINDAIYSLSEVEDPKQPQQKPVEFENTNIGDWLASRLDDAAANKPKRGLRPLLNHLQFNLDGLKADIADLKSAMVSRR